MAHQNISEPRHHRRIKSSVLSNISFIHKRAPSTGLSFGIRGHYNTTNNINDNKDDINSSITTDHCKWNALGERPHNQQCQQPLRSNPVNVESKGMKKSISSRSLKTLIKNEGRDGPVKTEVKHNKPSIVKSSTNFASLLSRPKISVDKNKETAHECPSMERDKENKLPFRSADNPPTPIYDQYSAEHYSVDLKHEINLYTPKEYVPARQRNFYEFGNLPALGKREEAPSRPRSTYLPSSFTIQDISKCVNEGSRHSAELIRRVSGKSLDPNRKKSVSLSKSEKSNISLANYGNRVLAAVSSPFGSKICQPLEDKCEPLVSSDEVDREFEAMLDRRNIPDHQRAKIRNLAVSLKKDFIRQDWAETAAVKERKLETKSKNTGSSVSSAGSTDAIENKSRRPRSRTFNLSIGGGKDSSVFPKKVKAEISTNKNMRKKSNESIRSGGKNFSAVGTAVAQNIIAKAKGQTADDFVTYLTKVSKPELVEVGRLHKLRLLLRNESVAWTDNFIRLGGMEEIVGLLYRTLAIEWRFVFSNQVGLFTYSVIEKSTKTLSCTKFSCA